MVAVCVVTCAQVCPWIKIIWPQFSEVLGGGGGGLSSAALSERPFEQYLSVTEPYLYCSNHENHIKEIFKI